MTSSFRGADLHCHSTFSDGVENPAALVQRALEAGLSALALSDHDALHGLPEFETAARGTGLITVPATELSTRCDGEDVHVLGLFVDAEERSFSAKLLQMRRDRDQRGEAMVARLAAAGFPLDLDEIRKTVGDGAFGRPHIARAMMAKGYVRLFDEAFDLYLSKGKPGYVPKAKWSLADAITAIRRAGGLAVLAHPIWYKSPVRIVDLGMEAGLDGIEAAHIDQDETQEGVFRKMAEERGLLLSAGSDYHGPPEGRKRVGTCRLAEEPWLRLAEKAQARRAEAGRAPLDLTPR